MEEWYQRFTDVDNQVLDLRDAKACETASSESRYIFNLAADMGGMGFIELNKAACMLTVLINTHMLMAARRAGAERFFFSSSACVYAAEKQTSADVQPLREDDAYPAMPEDGYGWEKLFSERMCRHFTEDFSFIDDCLECTLRLTESDVTEPLNIGSDQLVTINQLVDIVENIAGVKLRRQYKLDAPKGVRGRNSDNTLIKTRLGWAPSISLEDGMRKTYEWIHQQVTTAGQRILAQS